MAGFKEPTKACATSLGNLTHLTCNHEEADTRIILHACDAVSKCYNMLLVHCRETTKQRKCYSVHTITQRLPTPITKNILGFHALTECDTTSSFTGFGKRKCWKVFEEFPTLIRGLGRVGPNNEIEEFVCRLYRPQNPKSGVNKCRIDLFEKGNRDLEKTR